MSAGVSCWRWFAHAFWGSRQILQHLSFIILQSGRSLRCVDSSFSTSTSFRILAFGMLAALGLGACSSGEQHPSWVKGARTNDIDVVVGPCEDGTSRACGVKLEARVGIVTCFRGQQTCNAGTWGDCVSGQVLNVRTADALEPSTTRFLALSTPTACSLNPCDPRCQIYEEEPTEPIQSITVLNPFDWVTGSIGSLPGGLASKGLHEPCSTAADCQFNTVCTGPTLGSCAHSVCVAGSALDNGCSDCTTAICAAKSECCNQVPNVNTCSHDACVTGAALDADCNPCVKKICDKDPSCCNSKTGTWSSSCAAQVVTTCGYTCGCGTGESESQGSCYLFASATASWSSSRTSCASVAPGWDLAKITSATENSFVNSTWGTANSLWLGLSDSTTEGSWRWLSETSAASYFAWNSGATNSATADCAIMAKATNGTWSPKTCSSKYSRLCEGPKHVMQEPVLPVAWTDECVQLVASHCGAACDEKEPSSNSGVCTPWYPGQTRSSCGSADLAVGTPCDGTLPICNHGDKEAPAGIKIVHFPANSQQYPQCNPDQTHPQMKQCTTKEPIPPGMCINVTDCPGMSGNREIMVNPGGAGHVDECICGDNWSLYSGGECVEPICAGGSSAATATKKPIDIVFIIDNSSSMTEEIVEVQERINEDFAQIIGASDIDYRVIMFARYGDVYKAVGGSDHPICVKKPLGGNDCLDASKEALTLNPPRFYHYSADVESWNSWCLLLGTYAKADEAASDGRTWTAMAPSGWSQWLRPSAFKVFVEITDDDVSCSSYGYAFDDKNTVKDGQSAAAKFDQALLALDPDQFGTADNRNYIWHSIVAMKANTPVTLPWAATDPISTSKCTPGSEGPGTGYQALSKLTGGLRYPTCNYGDFNAIFTAIATDVIEQSTAACDFRLPTDQGIYDPQRITVNYSSTSGGTEKVTSLQKVTSATGCAGNAWYYDDPADPSLIKLCPATCSTVKADVTAKVVVELGCPGTAAPLTVTQTYVGTCDASSVNVWLDLAYSSAIFDDGTIVFRARVADSEPELLDAQWVSIGTATHATENCDLGSSCAINVFDRLGALAAQSPYVQLEITVNPSSAGRSPVLTDFRLSYSCVDNR